jgi:hypothetical protein
MSYNDYKGSMRPQNKRSRGRGGGGGGMHHGGHQGHQGGNRPRGPGRQQTFDSNGPGVKIRGNAYQVFERYMAMAREAQTSGDRISAENLYQHAEHYFRIMTANGEQYPRHQHSMTPSENEAHLQEDGGDGQPQQHGQGQGEGNEGQAVVERVQPPQAPPPDDEQPQERRD